MGQEEEDEVQDDEEENVEENLPEDEGEILPEDEEDILLQDVDEIFLEDDEEAILLIWWCELNEGPSVFLASFVPAYLSAYDMYYSRWKNK